MGFLKKQFKKGRARVKKWREEAPTRQKSRIETAKRRLELEKQRAEYARQKTQIAKAQSEARKYSQQFRGGGFGGSMSMQPSGISSPSYFAQNTTAKIKVVKPKNKRRKKLTIKKPKYIIRGGKAYPVG